MRLSALKARTRTVQVPIPPQNDDEPEEYIEVTYKPGELTLEVSDRLQEQIAINADDNEAVLKAMLLPLLETWDIEDEEGNQIPVNEETLRTIPLQFLMGVILTITADGRPDPQKVGSSDASSPLRDVSESSLSGT